MLVKCTQNFVLHTGQHQGNNGASAHLTVAAVHHSFDRIDTLVVRSHPAKAICSIGNGSECQPVTAFELSV
jgi:hypothetical protein